MASMYLIDCIDAAGCFHFEATDAMRLLRPDSNLVLKFDSPTKTGKRLASNATHHWASGNNSTEYSASVWARKQLSDFGWDWCTWSSLPSNSNHFLIIDETQVFLLIQHRQRYLQGRKCVRSSTRLFTSSIDWWVWSVVTNRLTCLVSQDQGHRKARPKLRQPCFPRKSTPDFLSTISGSRGHTWIYTVRVRLCVATSLIGFEIQLLIYIITGQQNNRRPNQTVPWVIKVTLPILTLSSPSYFRDATLAGYFLDTKINIPAARMQVIQPSNYTNNGPTLSLQISFVLPSDQFELWYPAALGVGRPRLYDLQLQLKLGGSEERIMTWVERVGFRTIFLNQESYTPTEIESGITPGTKFQFEINGHVFYVHGSKWDNLIPPLMDVVKSSDSRRRPHFKSLTFNFRTDSVFSIVPIDTYRGRVNMTTTAWLLNSALIGHQTMLRVFAGGAYQTDQFYDVSGHAHLGHNLSFSTLKALSADSAH